MIWLAGSIAYAVIVGLLLACKICLMELRAAHQRREYEDYE